MQFNYSQLMHTAETSISNAIGMHLMCEIPHIHFMYDLIEKFGVKSVQLALMDAELLKLMDAIEKHQTHGLNPHDFGKSLKPEVA